LFKWHLEKCESHPCFKRLDDEHVLSTDPAVKAMLYSTEESKKIDRLGGRKYYAVYVRLPIWTTISSSSSSSSSSVDGRSNDKYDCDDDGLGNNNSGLKRNFDSMIMKIFR